MYTGMGRAVIRRWGGLGASQTLIDAFTGEQRVINTAADALQLVMSDLSRGLHWDMMNPAQTDPTKQGVTLAIYGPTSQTPPYQYDYASWNTANVRAGSKTLDEWFSGGGVVPLPPVVTPPTTTGGPSTGGPVGPNVTDIVTPGLPGTVQSNLTPHTDDNGPGNGEKQTQLAGMPVLLGIGLLVLLMSQRRR